MADPLQSAPLGHDQPCQDYGASSHPTRPHLAFGACKELADIHSASLEGPSTARRKDSALGSLKLRNISRTA